MFVSATPGYMKRNIPTKLLNKLLDQQDFWIRNFVRKIDGQIDDLITEIYKTIENNGRVLVTTLTKKWQKT